MPKVIFLDIDGVLCTWRSHVADGGHKGTMRALDSIAVRLLNRLTRAGDEAVRYVLNSTWRKIMSRNEMTWHLNDHGWKGFFHDDWATGDHGHRGAAVKAWLAKHPEVETWIAIDDDSDFLPEQKPRLVQTHTHDGFSWQNFLDANRLLHGNEYAWERR